jgi:hypothetical protein
MRLILYLLLFVAISSFADSTKKILPLEIGGILKLSDIDKEEANLEYQIAQKRKEISLNTFEIYGLHTAFALTRFFYAYGDLYYQYFQVRAKENTQQDFIDVHNISLEFGVDLRLLLYQMHYFPLDIKLNVKTALIAGYAIHSESEFKNASIFGYSHAIGIYFLAFKHYFFTTGLDWLHYYSRADAKHSGIGSKKENSLLLDYDSHGKLYFSVGYHF